MSLTSFKDQIEAGFSVIRGFIPVTIIYNGNTYTGTRTTLSREILFTPGGLAHDYDFTVRIREDELAANGDDPREGRQGTGSLLAIDDVEYLIQVSSVDAVSSMRRLDLMARTR